MAGKFLLDSLLGISSGSIFFDASGRIFCALIFAFIIGAERSNKQKVAGIRTHCLLALASCVATLAGPLAAMLQAEANLDPSRLAGQILTGIGFVGAGAIVRRGHITVGLTTSASIFFAACLGVTCGLGFPSLCALVLLLLLFMGRIVEKFCPDDEAPSSRFLRVRIKPDDLEQLKALLPKDVSLKSLERGADYVELVIVINSRSWDAMDIIIQDLAKSLHIQAFEVLSY
ncbi:MAG: MgtC/SapB family protein [Candidatus Obscuribacterales bacterium]|nr:MgtC/SapB family protein [Candidatus Obscuribacterales bacterium]